MREGGRKGERENCLIRRVTCALLGRRDDQGFIQD